MDPVTQGVFGASAALLKRSRKATKNETRFLFAGGFLSGLLADIDIVIQSKTDPLLVLEYHRAFTHALAFIPMGALISFAILWPLFRRLRNFTLTKSQLFWACLLGYASHAPLDALTNYGTSLFLPFDRTRVSLNLMAVVDPFFTVPLILISIWGLWRNSNRTVFALYGWISLIFIFNFNNRELAVNKITATAKERGHHPESLLVKPTLLNGYLWRTIYRYDGNYHVDAVLALPGFQKLYPGNSVQAFDLARDFPELEGTSLAARDIQRFSYFSDDLLAIKDGEIIDVRFSGLPQSTKPLWSIRLGEKATTHVDYILSRPNDATSRAIYWKMMLGKDLNAQEKAKL